LFDLLQKEALDFWEKEQTKADIDHQSVKRQHAHLPLLTSR